MRKTIIMAVLMMMLLSISAFAGEGSDTVGGGKLLPQLRYGYSVSEWDTTNDCLVSEPGTINAHRYYAQVNWGILDNVELVALVGGQSFMMEDCMTGGLPPIVILTASEKTDGPIVHVGHRRQRDVLPVR